MSRKKVSTTCYFDAEEMAALQSLAARMHLPYAELVRVGVDAVLNVERIVGEVPQYQTIRNVLGLNADGACEQPTRPASTPLRRPPADRDQRRHDVLRFIADTIRDKGHAPSHAEIAICFNYASTSTPSLYVDTLERDGLIARVKHAHRGIALTDAGRAVLDALSSRTATDNLGA